MKFAAEPLKQSRRFALPMKESPKMKLWQTLLRLFRKFAPNAVRTVSFCLDNPAFP